jgi:hypothetical protein
VSHLWYATPTRMSKPEMNKGEAMQVQTTFVGMVKSGRFLFRVFLAIFFVLPLGAAESRMTFPAVARFVVCDDGTVDFGIAADTGALRYYRVEKKSPLIEYFSLSEGTLAQVGFAKGQWKYGWTEGKLQVNSGRVAPDSIGGERDALGGRPVIQPATVATENGAAEFEIRGKLLSDWTETVSFSNSPSGRSLSVRCKRPVPLEKPEGVSFSVKFMRWINEQDVHFTAVFSDGRREALPPEKAVAAAKVLVSFSQIGRRLELAAAKAVSVSLSKNIRPVGGSVLVFDMGGSSDFEIDVLDVETAITRQAGNLKVGVNRDNGTSYVTSGAMPLVSLEAFEQDETQALSGTVARSGWTVEGGGDPDLTVKASGKIVNDWSESISLTHDTVSYVFETSGKGGGGVRLKFPYWLVGSSCETVPPDDSTRQTASGGIPLRIGADMPFGEFQKGSGLLVWLTNTEQLHVKFDSPCAVMSYRGLRGCQKERVVPVSLHSFPPGGLELWPLSKEPLKFTLEYRQDSRQEMSVAELEKAAPYQTNDSVRISLSDSGALVVSPWWEVFHDRQTGGLLSSVKFKGGSGKNILAAPEKFYLMADGAEFSSLNEGAASFIVDGRSLIVSGKPTARDGADCGAFYVTRYDYSDGYIRRTTVFHPVKETKVNRLGVLRLDFIPELDECGYKPIVAAFKKAIFPGPPISHDEGLGGGFLSVFKSGAEGMDFVPGPERRQWTDQIQASPTEKSFQISGNESGGASIIVEPYSSANRQIRIKQSVCFDYYLGLPKLQRTFRKHYFPLRYQLWWFKKDWVNDEMIADSAEAGVNLAIDGNYGANWAGEAVPKEFSEKERMSFEVNKKRVDAWHRNGVKVVPFIGKGLFKDTVLPDHDKLMLWCMMRDDFKPAPTPWGYKMCHSSGDFDRYYKRFLSEWADALRLDGFYFDFCEPQGPCFNFNHSRFAHSDVDEFMNFMQWARSKFDVVYGHTGYYPTIMCENLVDLTWVGEEINFWYSNDGRLPSLNQMRNYFCHIPNTQRIVDPNIMARWRLLPSEPLKASPRYTGTDSLEFTCRTALCGLFSEANMAAAGPLSVSEVDTRFHPWLHVFSIFKDVDFTTLHFKDWKNQNAVLTGNSHVKAAIYWNSEVAYLVLGNPESTERQTCRFKLNFGALGWPEDNGTFELTRLPETRGSVRTISYESLTTGGMPEDLGAFEYRVFKIKNTKLTARMVGNEILRRVKTQDR